jgi:hypothetical protein
MARLHRKLAVRSNPQGLIIRPFDSTAQGPYRGSAVQIKWKTSNPVQLNEYQEDKEDQENDSSTLIVDGIAGLLKGFSGEQYLLCRPHD